MRGQGQGRPGGVQCKGGDRKWPSALGPRPAVSRRSGSSQTLCALGLRRTEFCRPLVVPLGERRRLTEESKDEVQLLLHRGAGEEGPPRGHLVVNAAHAPAGSNGQGRVRDGCSPTMPNPGGLKYVLALGWVAQPSPDYSLYGGVSRLQDALPAPLSLCTGCVCTASTPTAP